jgi:hypothetical protein
MIYGTGDDKVISEELSGSSCQELTWFLPPPKKTRRSKK